MITYKEINFDFKRMQCHLSLNYRLTLFKKGETRRAGRFEVIHFEIKFSKGKLHWYDGNSNKWFDHFYGSASSDAHLNELYQLYIIEKTILAPNVK